MLRETKATKTSKEVRRHEDNLETGDRKDVRPERAGSKKVLLSTGRKQKGKEITGRR